MDGRVGKRPDREPERPRSEADGEWGCLRSHRREAPAVLREDRPDAETAHTVQEKDLRLPRRLPRAAAAVKEESGLTWAEIARRIGTCRHTVWRWTEGVVRPNVEHMMTPLEVAEGLGLGHLFTGPPQR